MSDVVTQSWTVAADAPVRDDQLRAVVEEAGYRLV